MLDEEEHRRLYRQAYLPEHLPDYVEAVSGAESFLHEDHLCLLHKKHLTFIGYPLKKTCDTPRSYESACELFKPISIGIIAPKIWLASDTYESHPGDSYFRLNLPLDPLPQALDYMVRRGRRELEVREGRFGREHGKLVKAFLSCHELTSDLILIFKRISSYLKRSRTALLLEARKGDRLVSFNITDMGASEYAFYLFSFRSLEESVPGATDLLFFEMVRLAQRQSKRYINLGLGIHPGIRRFKEKWGGVPFLSYKSALIHRKPPEMGTLWDKL